jgi:hypothetical protein
MAAVLRVAAGTTADGLLAGCGPLLRPLGAAAAAIAVELDGQAPRAQYAVVERGRFAVVARVFPDCGALVSVAAAVGARGAAEPPQAAHVNAVLQVALGLDAGTLYPRRFAA